MTRLARSLERIVADLDDAGASWALVGGLAVSARAEPRTTRDVDVAVAVSDDDEAEALIRDLLHRPYVLVGTVEQRATERLATARLRPSSPVGAGALVDILFASSGIEQDIVSSATRVEVLPGLELPVAATGHLLALKVLARDDRDRPQDWDDIRALCHQAERRDLELAREAVAQIERRGYHRKRDLSAALQRVLTEVAQAED